MMSDSDPKGSESPFPECGLYKTVLAFPGKEDQLPAGCLVYFHNHSEQGEPILLLPASNTHNRWKFHGHGTLTSDLEYLSTLVPLLKEGFYILKRHLHVGDNVLGDATLVQLGYNTKGEPILFVAKRRKNVLEFPEKGIRFEDESIFEDLELAGFTVHSSEKKEPAKENASKPTLH